MQKKNHSVVCDVISPLFSHAVLPFLQQDKLRLVLLPIGAIVIMYALFTLLQFNVASMMMGWIVA
jgi:hypothetical protein